MPQFFCPINSENILVEDVKFIDSIFWNIVPVYCENIIIIGEELSNYGLACTNGIDIKKEIDIDFSKNAVIVYSTLDCNDDAFTLKAERGKDGKLKAPPTENVLIRNCTVKHASGGIAIGTETDTMICNVYMYNVIMEKTNSTLYFKTRHPRGGENM